MSVRNEDDTISSLDNSTVLVADDESLHIHQMKEALSEHATWQNYAVETCKNYAAAIAYVQTHSDSLAGAIINLRMERHLDGAEEFMANLESSSAGHVGVVFHSFDVRNVKGDSGFDRWIRRMAIEHLCYPLPKVSQTQDLQAALDWLAEQA